MDALAAMLVDDLSQLTHAPNASLEHAFKLVQMHRRCVLFYQQVSKLLLCVPLQPQQEFECCLKFAVRGHSLPVQPHCKPTGAFFCSRGGARQHRSECKDSHGLLLLAWRSKCTTGIDVALRRIEASGEVFCSSNTCVRFVRFVHV